MGLRLQGHIKRAEARGAAFLVRVVCAKAGRLSELSRDSLAVRDDALCQPVSIWAHACILIVFLSGTHRLVTVRPQRASACA